MPQIDPRANQLTVGKAQSNVYPWQPYPRPWVQQWPQVVTSTVIERHVDDYANEIEVERGEHDAVIRFYRTRDRSKRLVKEIVIPIGLLDWLQTEAAS